MNKIFTVAVSTITCLLVLSTAAYSAQVVVIPLGKTVKIEASISWQGGWISNTPYLEGDAVQYQGSSYLCVQEHTSNPSDYPPHAYWDLMADAGATGPKGDIGTIGPVGPQGVPGSTGNTGPQGSTGVTGQRGIEGPRGASGVQGPRGPQGTQGVLGPAGPQGIPGSQGPMGPQGIQGVPGQDGEGVPSGFFIMGNTDIAPNGFTYTGDRIFRDSWTQKSDMNVKRRSHAAAVAYDLLYVFGGYDSLSFASVEEYNPTTDTWTIKTDMPTPRSSAKACGVGGKIYVIGGADRSANDDSYNLNTVEEYDPLTDTWTTKASMPTARYAFGLACVNGKIYAIGGWANYLDLTEPYSVVEEYDPATDSWATKTSMPSGRSYINAESIDGLVYVFGSPSPGTMDIYNPATDSWSAGINMLIDKMGEFGSGVLNGKLYVVGGYPTNDSVLQYDPKLKVWSLVESMQQGAYELAAGVIGDKLYATGGDPPEVPPFGGDNILQVYSGDIYYIHRKD